MGLSKLGDFIELSDLRNNSLSLSEESVRGISIKKMFIPTKADMEGVSLRPYQIVMPDDFSYVTVTSRNGGKISLAQNTSQEKYLVSSSYIVFRIKDTNKLLSNYLYMYFNRPEFDRYARFNSWGSARETFSWNDMCDIEIEIPSIEIQQKYVDIYNAMKANQETYEQGLDDLKLTCDAYIENLRKELDLTSTGNYIDITDDRNTSLEFSSDDVKGMTITKQIIPTKADVKGTELSKFLIVKPKEFVYNPRTHGKKIGLGFNSTNTPFIISWNNTAFRVKSNEIIPEYLFMLFSRDEWDREACYRSWGSSTEVFTWDALCGIKIPVPTIEIQESIVNIYNAYMERKQINENLKQQIKDICPILIKGSLEEGKR